MSRNGVQFQKGLSEAEFDGRYGTEEQCRAVVIKLRWPNGFSCPVCGGTSSDRDADQRGQGVAADDRPWLRHRAGWHREQQDR
jgi:hypothetical protein